MGYAITAGVGVLLGVALLIWGLRERKARFAAEEDSANSRRDVQAAVEQARENLRAADQANLANGRLIKQLAHLRVRMDDLRERLVQCQDPKTIVEWLDAETSEETL